MQPYEKLADAFPAGPMYQVWYEKGATDERGRSIRCGELFTPDGERLIDINALSETHTCLGTVPYLGDDEGPAPLDRLYVRLQGENWGAYGRANKIIGEKGLTHTSMSVGDIIVTRHNEVCVVRPNGWSVIGRLDTGPFDQDRAEMTWAGHGKHPWRDPNTLVPEGRD